MSKNNVFSERILLAELDLDLCLDSRNLDLDQKITKVSEIKRHGKGTLLLIPETVQRFLLKVCLQRS